MRIPVTTVAAQFNLEAIPVKVGDNPSLHDAATSLLWRVRDLIEDTLSVNPEGQEQHIISLLRDLEMLQAWLRDLITKLDLLKDIHPDLLV